MGRKKKGAFSRENLLKDLDNHSAENAKESSSPPTKVFSTLPSIVLEEKVINEVFDDENDEIDYEKEACEANESEIDELNRLMSQVEIEDDPEELEKQINVAGVESNNMSQMYVL